MTVVQGRLSRIVAACIAAAVLIALWPLLRYYDWLNRDAQLYALQAVAHVHPERYANDLFFLFGSQDQFTAFTTLVAPLFDALNVERAAAWLTVGSNLAWWTACYFVARSLVGSRLAWLSVVAVMAIPGWYGGGGGVFRYAETYFSARIPAEALVLLALGLQLRGWWPAAALVLLASAAVHPLMTAPGVATFVLLLAPRRHWPLLAGGALVVLFIAALVAAYAPFGRLQVLDAQWLEIVRTRSSFLFPSRWIASDWSRFAATCLLLTTAAAMHEAGPTRRVAQASLVVGIGGVVAATVGSDVLPMEIILQGQPWRAMWLTTALAILLTPSAAVAGWRAGGLGRVVAMLLLTALCGLDGTTQVVAASAAAVCVVIRTRVSDRIGRVLFFAASAALAVTLVTSTLGVIDVLKVPVFGGGGDPRLEMPRNIAAFVVPALALAVVTWYATQWRPRAASLAAAACAAFALLVFVWRPALAELDSGAYVEVRKAAFADWRARIPPGTNVLWPTSPPGVWFLLERPSYLSISQLAGVVFSRDLALEGASRAKKISDYADPAWMLGDPVHAGDSLKPLTSELLARVCAVPEIGFVVSNVRLPEAVGTEAWPDSTHFIHLYDCGTIRARP